MPLPTHLESVPGAQELYDWFGYWPSFHDAEIVKFHFSLGEPVVLVIHTWEMTKQIDAAGFYGQTKHIVVEFLLDGVTTLNLQGDPWAHSIVFELAIKRSHTAFSLDISSSYGIAGTIEAKQLSLRISPGEPPVEPAASS